MPFSKDFNDLLEEILISYRNLGPIEQLDAVQLKADHPEIYAQYATQSQPDLSEGSVLFMKAACTASMLWGVYKAINKVSDQMFVDTADRRFKERHAAEYDVVTTGKSDVLIVEEVQAAKRNKLAGGNKYDYIAWARSVVRDTEIIVFAAVYPMAQGEGTFDIVVVSNENDGVPSAGIIEDITVLVEDRRPVGSGFSWGMRVLGPAALVTPVELSGTGSQWDKVATKSAIEAYMKSLVPGQVLYRSQLATLAHQYGAESAVVSSPDADILPLVDTAAGIYQMVRPGEVVV